MANTLNARIGRSTPSPASLSAIEIPRADNEHITLRRRPADRGAPMPPSRFKRYVVRIFRACLQRNDRQNGISAIGR